MRECLGGIDWELSAFRKGIGMTFFRMSCHITSVGLVEIIFFRACLAPEDFVPLRGPKGKAEWGAIALACGAPKSVHGTVVNRHGEDHQAWITR